MLNSVHMAGRVGKDPELRELGGKPFVSLRLAVDGYKGATDWFDVVCWGKVAEAAAAHLSKGRRVFVDGRLQVRSWKGEDGTRRYRTEVVAKTVTYLDRPPDESPRARPPLEDCIPSDSELNIPAEEAEFEAMDFDDDVDIEFP